MTQEPDAPGLLGAVLEAIPDAAFIVGRDMRVLAFNRRVRLVAPTMRRDDLIVRSLLAPEILDALAEVFEDGMGRTAPWRERVPVDRRFVAHINPLTVAHRPCALATLRDVTEAHALDRMRADFVANASHELRTPLASVLGFIETLQGPARDDAAARDKFLTVMGDQARRMARLIDDLLSLSRIEQHAHVVPQGRVDLSALAREMVDNLRPMAARADARLQVDAPRPTEVIGERDELVRAVENLIENAIKYGGAGPIDIVVDTHDGMGRLRVRDYGPGIAARHIPRLTERFYRVDTRESRAKGGTGLGLAIVKHIVARHRGRLAVDSSPGAGATFTITCPLADHAPGSPD